MSGAVANNWPKISIITSSLNHGNFIEETIKSVLDQNYPNFEHIIIDGFSIDKTADVAACYPHVKFIQQKSTAVEAYNIGLEMANGDIICYLNADDVYTLNSFFIVANKFKENPNLDVLSGQYQVEQNGKMVSQSYYSVDRLSFKGICFYSPGINALFFKRSFMINIGKFSTAYSLANDREYLLRCVLSVGKCYNIPDKILIYRLHNSSCTINQNVLYNRRIVTEHIKIIRDFLSYKKLSSSQRKILKAWRDFEKVRGLLIDIKEKRIYAFIINLFLFFITGAALTFMFRTLPIYARKKSFEYLTRN